MEITEIKNQLMLTQVLHYYGLAPDKHLRLHCPFHEDKTPSMQVYHKTGTVYCFSSNCQTHGKALDVIDFVMLKENITKHEAIEKCKELITGNTISTSAPATALTRTAVLTKMFMYFKNAVHNSKPARDYISSRGLDYTKLEIGYNTGQFHHGNRKEEALIKSCVEVGLLSEHDRLSRTGEISYKPFAKNCIVFALRNQLNQVSGLYFRSTVNDTDQRHFYVKNSEGLYPKYPESGTTKLIIAESVIDAATLEQIKAISNEYSILAAYGTNRLNEEMQAAIKGLQCLQEIVFAFDNDEAGNKAAVKYKEQLQQLLPNIIISKIVLPGKDVNETLLLHNKEIFTALLNERTTDFLSIENTPTPIPSIITEEKQENIISVENKKIIRDGLDISNPYKIRYATDTAVYYVQGSLPKTTDNLKIMLVVESVATGMKARNKVDLYEDKQTEKLCVEVAEKLYLRKDILQSELYTLTDLLEKHIESVLQLQQNKTSEGSAVPVLTVKERTALESFAKKPGVLKRLNELLGQTGIVGEERNRIFLLIIAISHKMQQPLHALIQGSSGSGKTRLLKQVSDCMPPESVTKLTRLSDKVLYNFPQYYFVNRLLCLEDIDGLSEEAEFAFRELQSNGELNSATSIKLDKGQITSGQKTVKGPIGSLACTTHGEIYEDNMSRVFLIAVDESAEQTQKIIDYQNKKAAGIIDYIKEQEIKLFIQNLVRLLQPCEVINPFANQLQLPAEAHKIRRLNELLQSFIKMVTIINQYQRKRDEKKRLITEVEDIEAAIHIMLESIILKVDELDGSLRQFYEKLKAFIIKKGRDYEFTRFEIREITGVGKTQQHHYINQLLSLEYIRQDGYANRGFRYKIVHWDNYTALKERIKNQLQKQVERIKTEHQRTPDRTPEPATTAD
jgi:DNA primase/energy-coupling factor transporter ATP-binding protein EcfA2